MENLFQITDREWVTHILVFVKEKQIFFRYVECIVRVRFQFFRRALDDLAHARFKCVLVIKA